MTSVSYNRDAQRILSASNDSTAKIYTCDMCGPLDRLREAVDRREKALR